MAITKPDLSEMADRGPLGQWRKEVAMPALADLTEDVFLKLERTPPEGHHPGMESRLAKIEAIIPTLATKADVEGVRTDLHKMDASITRWMIATVVSLFLGFAGLFFTMSNSINGALERATKPPASPAPAPQVVQPAPIIIQVPVQPASLAPPEPTPAKP